MVTPLNSEINNRNQNRYSKNCIFIAWQDLFVLFINIPFMHFLRINLSQYDTWNSQLQLRTHNFNLKQDSQKDMLNLVDLFEIWINDDFLVCLVIHRQNGPESPHQENAGSVPYNPHVHLSELHILSKSFRNISLFVWVYASEIKYVAIRRTRSDLR